ncbi:MAG: M20/M25/M40 family metallo-hydrolase [Vicinamibacterales bacterium]
MTLRPTTPTPAALTLAIVVGLAHVCAAQEPVDTAMVARIRAEGYERSKVLETFDHLVNVIGPRLTASPAFKTAVDWTTRHLTALGLDNVHTEPWDFGRGWTLQRFSVEMVEPRYMPLMGYPKAWSASTKGAITAAPLWAPTLADLKAKAGQLPQAIVMTRPIQEDFIREDRAPASGDLRREGGGPPSEAARREAQEATTLLQEERAGVTLEPNLGEHGTIFVTGRDGGPDAVPGVVLASEHYNLIARLLRQGVPVKLTVNVQGAFQEDDRRAYNVIADIAGADPHIGREIVMVGAHLDSWHSGTGATDNADGVSTAMEAFRILKALGVKPRRTIRLALWGGEEQGLLGSRAYVKAHLTGDAQQTARDDYSVYFNLDNGATPIAGFYLEGNAAFEPIMNAWLAPFADLGATVTTLGAIGQTDHLSFKAVGIPGFQAVQDYRNYDVRTHHTNVDTFERVNPESLKQAAVVMASVLYHAAMRDAKIPR